VSIGSVDREVQQSLGLEDGRGALVNSVYQNSPAGRAGILPGDVIIRVGNRPVNSSDDVVLRVGELPVNETADVQVLRNRQTITLPVEIVSRESEDTIAGQSQDLWTGASVYPLTQDLRRELDLADSDTGILVTQVVRRSPAAIAGMQNGDRIVQVNGQSVTNLREYYLALNSRLTGDIEFSYVRDGVELKITIVKN